MSAVHCLAGSSFRPTLQICIGSAGENNRHRSGAVRCATRRRLSMCNPSPIRRPTKTSPSVARVLHLERPGQADVQWGTSLQPHRPLETWGRDPSSPHTICICHAHFVSCAAAMRNALWLVARPSLSGIYYLVIYSPRTSLQAAPLRSRGDIMLSYQAPASLLTVAPG